MLGPRNYQGFWNLNFQMEKFQLGRPFFPTCLRKHMFSMTQDIACPSGCSTIIDRYDIWPQTVLIKDATAKTVADTFFSTEVARFASRVGCEERSTTVYRLPSNGIFEQWCRSLKATIILYIKKEATIGSAFSHQYQKNCSHQLRCN